MPDEEESPLVVTLQAQGRTLGLITSYSLNSGYTTSTDAFEFEVQNDDRDLLFGLEMEPVELSILGDSQMLGRIEASEAGQGLTRRYSGRDYLSDMVECHVDPTLKLKDGETVASAITLAASVVGIDTVQSDSDIALRNIRTGKSIASTKAAPDFREAKLKEYKPNAGEGIFEFCNRIAARHNSTIQPSTDRSEVVLTAPNYNQAPTYELVRTLDGGGNILRGSGRRDYSSLPTVLFAQGKFGGSAEIRKTVVSYVDWSEYMRVPPAAITARGQRRETSVVVSPAKPRASSTLNTNNTTQFSSEIAAALIDNAIQTRTKPGTVNDPLKLYRFHYMKDEQSRTVDQLNSVSKRRFAELAKNTLTYSCTVRGHRDPVSGAIWSVDTMAHVNDEVERVNETMWIHDRTLRYDSRSGATTELKLWLPNIFNI